MKHLICKIGKLGETQHSKSRRCLRLCPAKNPHAYLLVGGVDLGADKCIITKKGRGYAQIARNRRKERKYATPNYRLIESKNMFIG